MKDIALCVPETFYTPRMQQFIIQRCGDIDKQWIYFMIEGKPLKKEEEIFETHPSWLLCKDIHQGHDFRMLVIFKDPELKTLRDLRREHLPLLFEVKRGVTEYLLKHITGNVHNFKIYFHYTPSVYQLHAHVSIPGQYYNHWRTHNINHVISNIKSNTNHYRDAIIIFPMNKHIKALNIHNTIEFEDHENKDNQTHTDNPNTKSKNGTKNPPSTRHRNNETSRMYENRNQFFNEELKQKRSIPFNKKSKFQSVLDIEDMAYKTKA